MEEQNKAMKILRTRVLDANSWRKPRRSGTSEGC